ASLHCLPKHAGFGAQLRPSKQESRQSDTVGGCGNVRRTNPERPMSESEPGCSGVSAARPLLPTLRTFDGLAARSLECQLRTNALQQTAHSITSSACASKVGAVSADGIAPGRRQDCAGLQHIDLASVSQRGYASQIAGVRCTRATLIYLKAVRLDWSRPARDFIDDKLGEVFWRSALALDPCDPELMQAAFNRWSIKCLARCIVELLDDL